MDRYFEPAIRALDREVDNKERSQVHIAFARFADGQHEELRDMAKERNIRFAAYEKRKNLELKEMERRLQDGSLESGDIKRTRKQAEDHLEDDRRQLIEAQQLAKDMLWRALHNYALALTTSDAHDDHVFRFCALWLSCADDDDLHGKLKKPLADVPSHKFVFLAYQLSARLTKSPKPTAAASNIQTLVYRLCTQHPFHSLYPVQSLRSTEGGSAPSSRSSRRSSTMSRESSVGLGSNNSRAQAADDLLEKAKRSDRLRPRIEAVELVCCAYAEWASFNLKSHSAYLVDSSADSRQLKKGPLPIVRTLKIKARVQNLPIPVTTFHLPVDPTGRYDESTFPSIAKYDDYFETAGGIHLPKIVVCRGSDGVGYKQLVSGRYAGRIMDRFRSDHIASLEISSRATMISAKTPSWSRPLTSSIPSSPRTKAAADAISAFEPTKLFPCRTATGCWSLCGTLFLSVPSWPVSTSALTFSTVDLEPPCASPS